MNIKRLTTALSLIMAATMLWCGSGFAAYTPPVTPQNPLAPLCTPADILNKNYNCTDYFGVANYANSPLPKGSVTTITVDNGGSGYSAHPVITIADFNCTAPTGCGTGATATATVNGSGEITAITVTNGGSGYFAPAVTITDSTGDGTAAASAVIGGTLTGGIRKFVDTLPPLCALGTNNLGQCIPLASVNPADANRFPNADFYRVGLMDYTVKMHSDLPPTKLRGYVQLDANGNPPATQLVQDQKRYLGPLIVAQRGKPVRIHFKNLLANGTAGDLFLPTDTTYM